MCQQRPEGGAHVRLLVGLVRLEPRALVVARQRAQESEALVCEVGRHGRQINSPRNYIGAHWGATGACPRIPVASQCAPTRPVPIMRATSPPSPAAWRAAPVSCRRRRVLRAVTRAWYSTDRKST